MKVRYEIYDPDKDPADRKQKSVHRVHAVKEIPAKKPKKKRLPQRCDWDDMFGGRK